MHSLMAIPLAFSAPISLSPPKSTYKLTLAPARARVIRAMRVSRTSRVIRAMRTMRTLETDSKPVLGALPSQRGAGNGMVTRGPKQTMKSKGFHIQKPCFLLGLLGKTRLLMESTLFVEDFMVFQEARTST